MPASSRDGDRGSDVIVGAEKRKRADFFGCGSSGVGFPAVVSRTAGNDSVRLRTPITRAAVARTSGMASLNAAASCGAGSACVTSAATDAGVVAACSGGRR